MKKVKKKGEKKDGRKERRGQKSRKDVPRPRQRNIKGKNGGYKVQWQPLEGGGQRRGGV